MAEITKEQLEQAFGEDAALILHPVLSGEYTVEGLRERFECADRRYRECYHAPSIEDLMMTIANSVLGGYGVEGWAIGVDSGVSYVNMGDSYATTLILDVDDEFHIGCWAVFTPAEEE